MQQHIPQQSEADAAAAAPRTRRFGWAPIAAIALGAALGVVFFGDALSFETLRENREALTAWRDENLAAAALVFGGLYVLVVAFSIPGAVWMTLTGGFLFGLALGGPLIVLSATLGACLIFLAARTSLGEGLRARAGPWLDKLERGFRDNEISYLLILRLVPAVPFFVANLAPALLGVRFVNFAWTTLVGIIPGTLVYTWIGAGLGAVIDAGGEPDLGIIFRLEVLGPLLGLAALAALPIAIKAARGRGADAEAAQRRGADIETEQGS
ncbi:MAG: TVP38/TMEM64 family protein [Pseudomonadota bacterium]